MTMVILLKKWVMLIEQIIFLRGLNRRGSFSSISKYKKDNLLDFLSIFPQLKPLQLRCPLSRYPFWVEPVFKREEKKNILND